VDLKSFSIRREPLNFQSCLGNNGVEDRPD